MFITRRSQRSGSCLICTRPFDTVDFVRFLGLVISMSGTHFFLATAAKDKEYVQRIPTPH